MSPNNPVNADVRGSAVPYFCQRARVGNWER